MKRLFAIILTLCLLLGVLPAAEAYSCTTHNWSQWYPEMEPRCEYSGERFRYCLNCWQYEYDTIPALGHDYKSSVVEQPTCEGEGLIKYTCSRCGDSYEDEIEPLGHNWQQKTMRQATCTEGGVTANVCSRCGMTQDNSYANTPALGHKWGQWVIGTPSTCVEYGTRYHVCERCGEKVWERNYADGLGDHDWGEWKVIAQPAVGITGLEERVCKNDASHKEQREIPAVAAVINVWLEYKPHDVPDYPIEGTEIESEIIIHNDSNVPIMLAECILPDQAAGDWKTWEEMQGYIVLPGETAGYLHGIIINSNDIAAKEAVRTVSNTYTYESGAGTVSTGQTNPVQLRYPVLSGGASLKLELSWDDDEGVGKASLGALLDVQFRLTNTGAVPVVLDKPLGYYDPSLIGDMTALDIFVFDDTQFYLLNVGEVLTFTRLFEVDQASLDHMALFGEVSMDGRAVISEDRLGDDVWSNAVYMEIPLTEEADVYVLKGATEHFPGIAYASYIGGYEIMHGSDVWLDYVWADAVPNLEMIYEMESALYSDSGFADKLTDLPAEGATFYFSSTLVTNGNHSGKIDYTQIDPALVTCTIPGFSIGLVEIIQESADQVKLCFAATYLGAPVYILKGVDASFTGYEFDKEDDTYWPTWEGHSINCSWADSDNEPQTYYTSFNGLFPEPKGSARLTEEPVASDTYYFPISVNKEEGSQDEYDFSQIDPAQCNCTIPGFEVIFLMAETDDDCVHLWFEARYLGKPGQFVLKGMNASFTGYDFDTDNDSYWPDWSGHVIDPVWEDKAPQLGTYGTGINGFFLNADRSARLTLPPVVGETYYFPIFVSSVEYNADLFDFSQIDPAQMNCSIDGFTVAFERAEPYYIGETSYVDLVFSATYQGTSPSLFLEISWAPDEGVGKVVGDTIRERFKLTNTGNVTVAVPARLTDRHEDVVQPNWYLEINGTTYTVLKPGWDMEWTFLDEVYPEDAEKGSVSWSTSIFGYVLNLADETPGDAVLSNTAYIDIPLTGATAAASPALELITYNAPLKASYPYAELYSECDEIVRIDYVLTNKGNVPLLVRELEEKWGNGLNLFLSVQKTLYPGEAYSNYANVWMVSDVLTPNTDGPGIAGTVDVEFYAYGRDKDNQDTILCETAHCPYSFTMEAPGPTGWEIPSESQLWVWKYEKYGPTLPEGYQKGEQIVYVFEIDNVSDYVYGNDVEISGAVLTDSMLGVNETLPAIPAGSYITREYPYTVTEDDVKAGSIYNEVYLTWTDPESGETPEDYDWFLVNTTDKTSLLLRKEIIGGPKNGEYYVEGEEITFSVTAKNNTSMVLPQVFVNDPQIEGDSQTLMDIPDMQPGAEMTQSFKYKVTAADASYGYVLNAATADYEDANGDWNHVASNIVEAYTGEKKPTDTTVIPPVEPPYKPVFGIVSDISITKAQDNDPANYSYYTEGETIRYAITVKNEGEVPIDAEIYDSLAPGSGLIDTITGLAPNASKTVYYEYKVTKPDVDATCVVNYALAKWHPQGVWAETVYKSNEVTSPTSDKQPNPDHQLNLPGTGDSCWRKVTGVNEYSEEYLLHLCAEHAAIEASAGDDWQKAATLWREAVDAEYEKYLEAAEGAARVTIINERLTYYLWLGSYEKQLNLLYPNDPDTVAQKVAESLMDRCADLCYGEHNQGKAPEDSLTAARVMPGPNPAEACERRVIGKDGAEISYGFLFDAKHAATEKSALTLVREAEGGAAVAAAWTRAQQLWQMALDKEINALYKAAGKEDRQVIAMTRRFLDQLVTARTALLELVYDGDSTIISEQIERMYKEYAMILCGK